MNDFGYILFPSRTSQRMHQLLENRMTSVDERKKKEASVRDLGNRTQDTTLLLQDV
jgi:hypothetical protein